AWARWAPAPTSRPCSSWTATPTRWAWPSRCATTCWTSRPAARPWARPRARTWPRPSPPTPPCWAWTARAPSWSSWRCRCRPRWPGWAAAATCCRRSASWRCAATTEGRAIAGRKSKGPGVAGPFALALARRRLLHQAQGERIAVGLAAVGGHGGDDRQHDPAQGHGHQQQEADQHQGQHARDDRGDQHGDVEVQRFLALVVDEGH